MLANIQCYIKEDLLGTFKEDFIKISDEINGTLNEEQLKLKKYLESKADIDGLLGVGVLSKQDYFTHQNIQVVKEAFLLTINKIKASDLYAKEIEHAEAIYLKLNLTKKILRIPSKISEAFSRTGLMLNWIFVFLPGTITSIIIAFERDLTLPEKIIMTIEKQIDRLDSAKDEKMKRENEKNEKELEKEQRKANKEAQKAYKNSSKGKLEDEIKHLNRRISNIQIRLSQGEKHGNKIGVPADKAELALLTSKLNALNIQFASMK